MIPEDLVRAAVADEGPPASRADAGHDWPSVEQISRNPADALRTALALRASKAAQERAVAAHILSELLNPDQTYVAEALDVLGSMLEGETDLHVQWSIVDALRFIHDVRALQPLLSLRGHPSPNIRWKVAEALGTCMGDTVDARGIEALIALSQDHEREVRDWATFALGTLLDTDSPAVREALWRRVADDDPDTRAEALVGLARRQDRRVVEPLRRELAATSVGREVVEAAAEIGDESLLDSLTKLRAWWDVDVDLLDRATKRCSGQLPRESV